MFRRNFIMKFLLLAMKDIAGLLLVFIMFTTFMILILRRKCLGKNIGIFIIAMGVITFVQAYGSYYRAIDQEYNSYPVSIIGVAFILFLLLFLYFHLTLQTRKFKTISKWLIILFLLNYLLSVLLFENFLYNPPLTVYFGGIFLLSTTIIMVLAETFNSPEIFSLKSYFPFWVCISILITYLGAGPLVLARHTLQSLGADVYYLVLLLVNILGYSVLLVGVFNAKNENKV